MQQLEIDIPSQVPDSVYEYGARSSGETHGLVLTKPHVVDLILDMVGYTADLPLHALRLLEPASGHGAFLVRAVDRLLEAARREGCPLKELGDAIRAFDIDASHVQASQDALLATLKKAGAEPVIAANLVKQWVSQGDFLLSSLDSDFDVVVGNPPYVRIEQLARQLQIIYRARYRTLFDRADLYVAFIERSLDLLSASGRLGFICADRWTLNRYGAPLRALVSTGFEVRSYIDLHNASPFESEVVAYPSIFVIGKERTGCDTKVMRFRTASASECSRATAALSGRTEGAEVEAYKHWFQGDEPWVMSPPKCREALRDLERRHPLIEGDGKTFVRIGVATGCDKVLIVPAGADIEPSRLLPLVKRDDLQVGLVVDGGRCVINTYEDGAGVVSLDNYPKLRSYVEDHAVALKRRHIAKKSKHGWFKTIDRVYPSLANKPKLLIPDIAGSNEVVFEEGHFYPHHNLYFIISDSWDLRVLGGLLSSRVALFFVWSYAVKMRGGYLRFQAQYLRRIRVPELASLSDGLKIQVCSAFEDRDFERLDALALEAYGLQSLPDFDFVDTRS